MEINTVTAKLNNLRISPRKVAVVADALRNKDYISAKRILKFAEKKSAIPLLKLLESARVNAKSKGLKEETVYIKEVLLGPGTILKRGRFVSRGGHHKIMKRTTNVVITLGGQAEVEAKTEDSKSKNSKPKNSKSKKVENLESKKGKVKRNGK